MLGGTVAKRYADALFSLAKEQNGVDRVESDLTLILTMINDYPQLKRILQHPAIMADVKKKQVSELFGKALSATTMNFIYLLLDRRRENQLTGILEEYTRLADEYRGVVKAYVETAFPLSDEDLAGLREKLAGAYGKKLQIKPSVNSNLIAGVLLKVGDRVIDASVKGQLDRFSQNLKRNQVR